MRRERRKLLKRIFFAEKAKAIADRAAHERLLNRPVWNKYVYPHDGGVHYPKMPSLERSPLMRAEEHRQVKIGATPPRR